MDNYNCMYLCIYRQISRLVHSNLLIVRLLPSSEHCTMSAELSKSGVYIRYNEVEVHRGPMPLIVAPLRIVY